MKRGVKLCGLCAALAMGGASGAWAGDGVVALQTADPSCADGSDNTYVDCGNGTVTDNRSGLVWLKNPHCWSTFVNEDTVLMDWHQALEVVANLSDLGPDLSAYDCGLEDGSSPGEWRLPTQVEWIAMVADAKDQGCNPTITDDSGTACRISCAFGFGECSFFGVMSTVYWSSTTELTLNANAATALVMDLASGEPDFATKTDDAPLVWPVRGGQ